MRILLFAEAVTLAHVARPLVLAEAAARQGHSCVVACDERYRRFVEGAHIPWRPLTTIGSDRFARALIHGDPIYDLPVLRAYVRHDLQLMRELAPDVVVGDFRLSLSVSARLVRIPYATVTNAYWSPFVADRRPEMPVLAMNRQLPLPLAQALFRVFSPAVMRLHCVAFNRLRRENGMPPVGADLRNVYTDADYTLYADAPEIFPLRGQPATHIHLGPVLWSPPVEAPPWWDDLPANRPIVYVTLGSSGDRSVLARVLTALSGLPIVVIASSAGAEVAGVKSPNSYVAEYLPGLQAARRSRLVVCNGGSPTSQQALAHGVPVLGIASNMDQFLNMRNLLDLGVGQILRADRVSPQAVSARVMQLLDDTAAQTRAAELARTFAQYDAGRAFVSLASTLAALSIAQTQEPAWRSGLGVAKSIDPGSQAKYATTSSRAMP